MHTPDRVTSLQQLRQLIPSPNGMLAKRIQTRLDHLCLEFIHQATLMVATRHPEAMSSTRSSTGVFALVPDGSGVNVLQGASAEFLVFALPPNPESWGVTADDRMAGAVSLYFLVTGIGHGLRVNGHYDIQTRAGQPIMTVRVETAYLHCARAATRGDLWAAKPIAASEPPPSSLPALLAECRYALIHTSNAEGQSQLSPRGDPAGFMHCLDDGRLFLAERPGNKVAVSLSNILEQPAVAVVGLFPGWPGWLELAGTASIATDPYLLDRCTVAGKRPHLGILLSLDYWAWRPAMSLSSPSLWSPASGTPTEAVVTPFARALAEHMQGKGLMGKVVHKVVDTVVKRDMKRLY